MHILVILNWKEKYESLKIINDPETDINYDPKAWRNAQIEDMTNHGPGTGPYYYKKLEYNSYILYYNIKINAII